MVPGSQGWDQFPLVQTIHHEWMWDLPPTEGATEASFVELVKKKNTGCILNGSFLTVPHGKMGFPSGASGKEPTYQCRRYKRHRFETSLMAQWLRIWAPNAGGLGSILGQGTRSHMPQLWPKYSQINEYIFLKRETQVQSLGQASSLEEDMETYSSILAWRIPRTEEPGGLWSIGSQSPTQLKRLSTHTCMEK